jgi:muramoyltetrapeptide carboxypeptidase
MAGSDDDRRRGLEWVLERGPRVVIAARGGYGVTRLMPGLPVTDLAASGVTFVGFSDITALLNGMVAAGGGPQIHGPMVAAGLARPRNAARLRNLLSGDLESRPLFEFRDSQVVRPGRAFGRVVGGNLALIEAALGTSYEPDFSDAILFLEEVGEPLYRLDRMLTHLRASARLRGVKALICGRLRGCRPARECAGKWLDMVTESVPETVPVVVDLPFGHGAVNLAFPIGTGVEVDTSSGEIRWSS